ncbi:Tyrosine-protein kinase transforming protein RYK [Geodia barretti]|uniref:Tyrosine-protein kinase transforming protein RYK n=1 Tax=Geodia barretti TaxID=519541 RepID=A0AA35XJN8_GEOBA|nr:Tyrosine-protein kinase transforming protein RYK [Geodia barretti]
MDSLMHRIDGEGVIKVADFGLTEDMYCTNYFRRRKSETGHEEKVPVRWMAPESIEDSVYTQATDVWSYGVTMWEIFTCGRVPYAGIHAMGLLKQLKRGERLEKPDNKACHDDIYDVMFSCWKLEAGGRPKFSDLVVTVNDLLERDAGYLELSRFPTLTVATTTPPPPSPADHPLAELAVSEPDMDNDLRV